MPDEQVRVETVWTLKDEASSRMAIIRSHALGLTSLLDRVKGHFYGIAAAAGVGLGTAGVVSFIRSLVQTNRELENVKFSMGGLLWQSQQMGTLPATFQDLNAAIAYAGQLYEGLEQYAARALGTTEEYVHAWQEMALPVWKARGGMEELLELTKLLVPIAMQFRIPLDVAARDIRQALMGHMTVIDQTTRMLGLETTVVNELYRRDPHAVLEMLLRSMRTAADSAKAAGELFDAQAATLEDVWLRFKRELGAPLFDELRQQVARLIAYIELHQEAIRDTARQWGEELRKAFSAVVDAVEWIHRHWAAISETVKVLVEIWLAKKFVAALVRAAEIVRSIRLAFVGAGAAAAAGATIGSGATGLAAAAAGGGLARAVSFAISNASIVITAGAVLYGLGEYLVERERREADLLQRVKLEMPWLYEEAVRYAELTKEKRVSHGEIIDDRLARITQYIEEHYEAAKQEQLELRQWAQQFAEESSEMHELFFGGMSIPAERKPPMEKPPAPIVDMRGAHFEVKVDARHTDPDRIAATIVNTLARYAMRQTRAATGRPLLTGG